MWRWRWKEWTRDIKDEGEYKAPVFDPLSGKTERSCVCIAHFVRTQLPYGDKKQAKGKSGHLRVKLRLRHHFSLVFQKVLDAIWVSGGGVQGKIKNVSNKIIRKQLDKPLKLSSKMKDSSASRLQIKEVGITYAVKCVWGTQLCRFWFS